MSRIKKVFSKEDLAHHWANSALDAPHDSRTPTGNLFTRGVYVSGRTEPDSAIWSYGSHYCLARMTRDRKGAPVVLFNQNAYSKTTQRQRGLVRYALPPATYAGGFFECDKPQAASVADHMTNLADYRDRYETAVKSAGRPRIRAHTRAAFLSLAARILDEANRYAVAFGLSRHKLKPQNVEQIAARVAREAKAADKLRAEQAERYAAEHAAELAEYAERVREWKQGGNLGRVIYSAPVALRISGTGPADTLAERLAREAHIETTHGAHFPMADARRLWPLILAARKAGREFAPAGLRSVMLGHYPLTKIEADGTVRAGCHTVPFAECAELAAVLGLES